MKLDKLLLRSIYFILILFSENVNASDLYGHVGNLVYKTDMSGNSIWVKDISGIISSDTTYDNKVVATTFDGGSVFVLTLQGPAIAAPGSHYYPSVLVLDSNGNFQNVIYHHIITAGSFQEINIMHSFTGGAWYLDEEFIGSSTHYLSLTKVDRQGNPLTRIHVNNSATGLMIGLADSNYVVSTVYNPPTNTQQHSTITKFDESGFVIWSNNYFVTNTNFTSRLSILTTTSDSLGNIYAFAKCENFTTTPSEGICGIKLDPFGNIILSKLFDNFPVNSNHTLSFRNGEVIDVYYNTEIHFDDQLTDSCITTSAININSGIDTTFSTITLRPNFTSGFLPSNGQSLIISPIIYPEYCSTILTTNDFENNFISVYPNPAINFLNLNMKSQELNGTEIKIIDNQGRYILSTEINSSQINISKLNQGVYFLRFNNSDETKTVRFIKID